MANLIIKSTANDLVIQGSDASPAITAGATGTTTFAENATLSGTANNLGTSTAGTIGSGVTFPVGHVVQTVSDSITGDGVSITQALGTGYVRADTMTKQITGVVSGNDVLITMNFGYEISSNDVADGGAFCIFRESAVISSHNDGHQIYVGQGQHNWYNICHLSYLDTSPAVGTNNYYVGRCTYNNASIRIDAAQKFNIILQEIQG
jgi:hypothetical protein